MTEPLKLRVESYGKGIIVRGEDTKKYKDYLKNIAGGAKFSMGNLDGGEPGWIYMGSKRAEVEQAIQNRLEGVKPKVFQGGAGPKEQKSGGIESMILKPPSAVLSSVHETKSNDGALEKRVAKLEQVLSMILNSNENLEQLRQNQTIKELFKPASPVSTPASIDFVSEDQAPTRLKPLK